MKNKSWKHQKYIIHYYVAGNKDNPVLIFFHGFLGSGLDWEEVIDHFAKKYFCIAIDLPAHGKTSVKFSQADYSMEAFSDVFCRFINDIGISKPVLIGYSMGGRLILFLLVHYPKIWKAAVLESASPGLRTAKEREERRKKDAKIARKLETETYDKFLTDWYRQPLFQSLKNNKKFPKLFLQRLENNPHLLAISLRMMGLGAQPSLWKAGQRIDTPILLLTGEFDRKFRNILSDTHAVYPRSELRIIEKAGHNAHFEQPLTYYKLVDQFLNKYGESS